LVGSVDGADRAGESADMKAVEFAAGVEPGCAGAGFGDADQQQRQPAADAGRAVAATRTRTA